MYLYSAKDTELFFVYVSLFFPPIDLKNQQQNCAEQQTS